MVLSSLICFISYRSGASSLSILTVVTPSLIAAVLTFRAEGKKGIYDLFVEQTVKKAGLHWFVLSMFGIPLLASLAVLTSLHFDLSKFGLRTTQVLPQIPVILLIALGEEYGWRGFLLPRLMKRFSVFHASILLGLLWGLWHFPAYLIGTGVPQQMNFLVFMLWVILGTLFISWIYFYTKNVLTSVLAHISANAAFNYLFLLPEFTGNMHAFWMFIAYLAALVSLVYYFGRKELV